MSLKYALSRFQAALEEQKPRPSSDDLDALADKIGTGLQSVSELLVEYIHTLEDIGGLDTQQVRAVTRRKEKLQELSESLFDYLHNVPDELEHNLGEGSV